MDWAVGLAFPCQQPMLHANGVTEIPKFRITPDYNAKRKDTDTWRGRPQRRPARHQRSAAARPRDGDATCRTTGAATGVRCASSTPSSTPKPRQLDFGTATPAGCSPGTHQDQAMTSDRIRLGAATLTRVIEFQVDNLPAEVFPLRRRKSGVEDSGASGPPTYWNAERLADRHAGLGHRGRRADRASSTPGRATSKARPLMAVLDHPQTDFLGMLRRAGFDPASSTSSSTPTCTSITSVGTPRARATHGSRHSQRAATWCPKADYRHFCPDGPTQTSTAPQSRSEEPRSEHVRTVFADSVSPVDGADRGMVRRASAAASWCGCVRRRSRAELVGGVAGRGRAHRLRR